MTASSGFGGWVRVRADRGVVDSFILIDTHTNTSDSYTHSHSFTVYAPMILSGIRRGVRKRGVQAQWVSHREYRYGSRRGGGEGLLYVSASV